MKSCYAFKYVEGSLECSVCENSMECKESSPTAVPQTAGPVREAVVQALEVNGGWLTYADLCRHVFETLKKRRKCRRNSSLHYHIGSLKREGLVTMTRVGKSVYYSLTNG